MTTKTKFLTVCVCAASLGLAACSDDSDDTVHNLTQASDLQGMFRSGCQSADLLNLSEENSLNFQANDFSRIQRYYTAEDCKSQEAMVIEYVGEFRADENDIRGKAGSLDIDINKVKVTVNDDTVATALSAANFCGVHEYKKGQTYEISGEQTEGLCPILNVPTKRYGAYDVDGDTLLLDSHITGMATHPNARSTDLKVEFKKD